MYCHDEVKASHFVQPVKLAQTMFVNPQQYEMVLNHGHGWDDEKKRALSWRSGYPTDPDTVSRLRYEYKMDMKAIWAEFEENGITKDLDDMDHLMIKSRRKKSTPAQDNDSMVKAIEKIRRILVNMKPLSGRKFCVFCKNNKEQPSVFNTHVVKNEKGEVTCPILNK
ncbi:nanos-like protein [Plakobranchus ocellatus]|uniref:Nanos-like protein n=1 Tax=Plakobranchus ocellatus TaxID=259542 RepID=A0AAV4E123_9GAST|nr:nanos-like protein [Plakobranchus ocellatus]